MSQELHYTSVPRGLKPGARGFCTVACTSGLSPVLAERLEGLSGYRAKFPPDDPDAPKNPIAWSHVRLSIAGQTASVVSRVGPAGLDYTDRPNKYAHHLVLESAERPSGGPAWLLQQAGVMAAEWTGPPLQMPAGRRLPAGDRPGGICRSWEAQAGDAGWGGVVAETFLHDPRRQVVIVFDPGDDVLGLFAEAIALLPADRRWEVTFQTYFTGLPPGVSCAWRGVLRDTPEDRQARGNPDALLIDLAAPKGRAAGGPLVHQARTGEIPVRSSAPPMPSPSGSAVVASPIVSAAAPPRQAARPAPPPPATQEHYGFAPPAPPPMRSSESRPRASRSSGISRRSIIVAAIIGFVLGSAAGGGTVFMLLQQRGEDVVARSEIAVAKDAEKQAQTKAVQADTTGKSVEKTPSAAPPKVVDDSKKEATTPASENLTAKDPQIADAGVKQAPGSLPIDKNNNADANKPPTQVEVKHNEVKAVATSDSGSGPIAVNSLVSRDDHHAIDS